MIAVTDVIWSTSGVDKRSADNRHI